MCAVPEEFALPEQHRIPTKFADADEIANVELNTEVNVKGVLFEVQDSCPSCLRFFHTTVSNFNEIIIHELGYYARTFVS